MHNVLGPGEEKNQPITVHMLNSKKKITFGFSGLQEKGGRVTALFNTSTKGHKWVKVEQVKPYEWRELPEVTINDEYCWKHKSPHGGWTCAICRNKGENND